MLSMTRFGRRAPTVLVAIVVAVVVAACGGSAGAAPRGLDSVGNPVDGSGQEPGQELPSSGNGDGSGGRPAYLAGAPDLLIIKTGALALQVTGIDAALATATQQITALGGYASGSERSGEDESAQATVTFRIPAPKWEDALTGLRSLGTKILGERTATEDVTSQVVDLGARVTNLRATETALQGIMERAVEIKDVLAVQAELTSVRSQIEQLTAQKLHLEEQASFSTLAVTFSLKPDPILTSQQQFDPKSEVDEASASLVSVLQALATAGIWFAIVWLPILVALAVVVGVGAWVYRRMRRPAAVPPSSASL